MKNPLLILAFIFIPYCLNSQQIRFQTGIHFSSMKDLHELNKTLENKTIFETKTVSEFPGYLYYKPSVSLEFGNVSLGISYFYNSTGSRISAKDFSGEYKLDMIIHTNAPVIFADINIPLKGKLFYEFESSLGLLFSELKLNESLLIGSRNIMAYESKFKSLNFFYLPEFRAIFPWNYFGFGVNIGYLIQFGENTFSNINIKPGWSGFNFGVSVRYSIKNK